MLPKFKFHRIYRIQVWMLNFSACMFGKWKRSSNLRSSSYLLENYNKTNRNKQQTITVYSRYFLFYNKANQRCAMARVWWRKCVVCYLNVISNANWFSARWVQLEIFINLFFRNSTQMFQDVPGPKQFYADSSATVSFIDT